LLLPLWNAAWAEDAAAGKTIKVTASSEESDKDNMAAKAFDGNADTRWCASSEASDEWLQFDFGQSQKLGGVEADWEFSDKEYGYVIEGSNDGTDWKELAKAKSTEDKRVKISGAYSSLRIKVTTLPEASWASISEVRLFDDAGKAIKGEVKKESAKSITLTASSEETGNTPAKAFDDSMDSRWCASSDAVDEWLQLSFDKPKNVGSVEVNWEFPEEEYGYTIEGSADGKDWKELAKLKDTGAKTTKVSGTFSALRVKVTSLPEGKWASITEVRLLDTDGKAIKN